MYPLCRHIKTNGLQCQSPAMRDQPFCYYHRNARDRDRISGHTAAPASETERLADGSHTAGSAPVPSAQEPLEAAHHAVLELGLLEDVEAIQVAISTVVSAIARNRIDAGRSRRLLYGLRLAANNVQRLPRRKVCNRKDIVTATTTLNGELVAASSGEPEDLAIQPEHPTSESAVENRAEDSN